MNLKEALDNARIVQASTESGDQDFTDALAALVRAVEITGTESPQINPDCPQPSVHLNGTGLRTLQDECVNAHLRLQEALTAFGEMTTHGRDFYTQDDTEALTKAITERDRMANMLHTVSNYIHLRMEHLTDIELSR